MIATKNGLYFFENVDTDLKQKKKSVFSASSDCENCTQLLSWTIIDQ